MAMLEDQEKAVAAAFEAGRRVGFGVSALALGCVAFLSLLGAEKAILAIVLGALARRGGLGGPLARRLGTAAIGLGSLFLASMAVLLIVFWDKVVEFITLLDTLS